MVPVNKLLSVGQGPSIPRSQKGPIPPDAWVIQHFWSLGSSICSEPAHKILQKMQHFPFPEYGHRGKYLQLWGHLGKPGGEDGWNTSETMAGPSPEGLSLSSVQILGVQHWLWTSHQGRDPDFSLQQPLYLDFHFHGTPPNNLLLIISDQLPSAHVPEGHIFQFPSCPCGLLCQRHIPVRWKHLFLPPFTHHYLLQLAPLPSSVRMLVSSLPNAL